MALSTSQVKIADEDEATLVRWSRSSSVRAGLAMRARIVLAAACGEGTSSISRRLGVSRPTVIHWRDRYAAAGLAGLHDAERSGRPKTMGDATVARAWRRYGVQPWRRGTFKFSTDPELEAKVRDVVGLYLNPPEHAIVLCVDEKSQIQALERTQPILPVRPGLPERATHDYK